MRCKGVPGGHRKASPQGEAGLPCLLGGDILVLYLIGQWKDNFRTFVSFDNKLLRVT